ncbi:hypothetical protein [Stratiformator vulcanicus]|uniref:[Butirosin acyl-carrier protein]--L-glutamate ligase n=1 Tax=Stratiformator vulcanicus TaxID=2527980 RepID=A0A517R268_9PLAN|nr:hypothetical protein [Stratiformator vulcanicus]QDT37954.1 [Butirosin acyl-carrier protein]--L-glutamate ligase [Stratiformator vulcanicus]
MTTASPEKSDAFSKAEFVDTRGNLPPLWSRKVIFFANLLGLFYGNEAETAALRDEVGEIDSYGGRLIPILNLLFRGDDNLLLLEREASEEHCRYLRDDLGLSLPRLHVMPHDQYLELNRHLKEQHSANIAALLDVTGRHNTDWIDGYVTDETLTRVAEHLNCRTISTMAASRDGNNKLLLHRYLKEAGLPTIETLEANSRDNAIQAAKQLQQRGFGSAVIRSQIGASGIGTLHVRPPYDQSSFPPIPEYYFYEGPCMVQGWLGKGTMDVRHVHSPSTQIFLDESRVYAFDLTEQILSDESVHQGNESPPTYLARFPALREEMMRQAESAGGWLHQTGYRGTASIDWLVVEKEGRSTPEVYVCEINARVTGATYPSLLGRHFNPSGAWLLQNLRLGVPATAEDLLKMLEQPGHLYHPGKNAGVLPLNLNFGKDNLVHKGQFLCLGRTVEECHQFLSLAEQDMPVTWNRDRD